jgi:hypothetical protein
MAKSAAGPQIRHVAIEGFRGSSPGRRRGGSRWQHSLFTARLSAVVLITKRIAFLTPVGRRDLRLREERR